MVSRVLEQFRRYMELLRVARAPLDPQFEDLSSEVVERLQQLDFILTDLDRMDAEYGTVLIVERTHEAGETEHHNAVFERDQALRFVMRLETEAFYYFAFRARQILRNKVHPFPGLEGFEAVGVRDVRNQLIEHPEGSASRIFNRTWMWSQGSGMRLKSGRHEWESASFSDEGLRANAAEYISSLQSILSSVLAELERPGATGPSARAPAVSG